MDCHMMVSKPEQVKYPPNPHRLKYIDAPPLLSGWMPLQTQVVNYTVSTSKQRVSLLTKRQSYPKAEYPNYDQRTQFPSSRSYTERT